jgi:hypothetical protein
MAPQCRLCKTPSITSSNGPSGKHTCDGKEPSATWTFERLANAGRSLAVHNIGKRLFWDRRSVFSLHFSWRLTLNGDGAWMIYELTTRVHSGSRDDGLLLWLPRVQPDVGAASSGRHLFRSD